MAEKTTGLTSIQAAVITTGESVGILFGPIVAGFLLCSAGYISIIYLTLAGCLAQGLVLIAIVLTISMSNKNKKSPLQNVCPN